MNEEEATTEAQQPEVESSEEQTTETAENTQVEQTENTEQPKQAETETTDDDDDNYSYQYEPSQYEIPAFDLSNLKADEDGTLDGSALSGSINEWGQQLYQTAAQQAQAQAAQTYQMMRAEEKAWDKIQKQYPEVAESKRLKQIIHNQRNADILNGGRGDLTKAAKDVLEEFRGAKSEGKSQAQESIKIQQSAHLESSGVTAKPKATKKQELYNRAMTSRGRERDDARRELLKEMRKNGEL